MTLSVARPVDGSLDAVFRAGKMGCRVDARAVAPLELRGPFRATNLPPQYFVRNVTGGICGGDRLRTRIEVGEGAAIRIATTSASKVCAMPSAPATSALELVAHRGSVAVYESHATILQRDSDFSQRVRLDVRPGAGVLFSDIVMLGRLAHGERLVFRRFASELLVQSGAAATPSFIERYEVRPERDPTLDAALGGYGVIGSLYALGTSADGVDLDALAAWCAEDCRAYAGADALPNGAGIVVRFLAPDGWTARSFVRSASRCALSGRDARRNADGQP
ncbi:MAG TPA: urease accessory protein UreD [Dehalococcoidia bacterium]|nr:urease accessory protein UreD [Dehalococcoidia bacterium]